VTSVSTSGGPVLHGRAAGSPAHIQESYTVDSRALLLEFIRARKLYRKSLARCYGNAPALFRTVRRQLELSQSQMAEQLAVSKVWLCYVERGRRRPGPELLRALYLVAMGVPYKR
jgi:DNA-binding transcriptional regulator YiaG